MNCRRIFKSVSVTVASGFMVVDFGTILNFMLKNLKDYKFIICEEIPIAPSLLNVQFKINGVLYPVLTNAGNNFISDQLRRRIIYCAVYGNNPKHFLIKNCLPETSFVPTGVAGLKENETTTLKTK